MSSDGFSVPPDVVNVELNVTVRVDSIGSHIVNIECGVSEWSTVVVDGVRRRDIVLASTQGTGEELRSVGGALLR